MRHVLLIILALATATAGLSGCNAVHGAGEDLQSASGK